MRILGIDPGLATVGWAVIDSERGNLFPVAYGAITTPAHTDIEARLLMIKNDLETVIDKYSPSEMAIEELFFNTNITTGIAVAEARGVILCTAHAKGVIVGSGIICWILSTFISNSAAAALMVPILAAVGKGMGPLLDPYGGIGTLLIGIAMSASFAMALPISTPPNAIAYSTGLIKSSQMCIVGVIVGVFALIIGYITLVIIGRLGFF